jgi:hypothetical protein
MNQQLWIMVLTFVAGVLALASQMLPVSPELVPWLAFLVAVINLALAIFFGVTGLRTRAELKAKAAK